MKILPNAGERIVVHGITLAQTTVESVVWDDKKHDWKINLDWGTFGKSRVWAHDENKVWYRWKDNN